MMDTSPCQKIKIAYADDQFTVRKAIIQLLHNTGDFEVIIDAGNGKELIEAISQSAVKPDICLIDIAMPVMNGHETAVLLKRQWPAIKIVALSMFDEDYNVIRMISNGAIAFLTKHTPPDELFNALQEVHLNGYYYSEFVSQKLDGRQKQNAEARLSPQELRFLRLCATDLSYDQIARELHLSYRTVDGYRESLFKKFHVKSRSSLILFALKNAIVTI